MPQTDAQLKCSHCCLYAIFIFIFRHISRCLSAAACRFDLPIKRAVSTKTIKKTFEASTLRSYINRRLHLNCASNPVQPTAAASARQSETKPDTKTDTRVQSQVAIASFKFKPSSVRNDSATRVDEFF